MKVKASELSGVALHWAVAHCKGLVQGQIAIDGVTQGFYNPSTDWAQGGPIIEEERIDTNTSYPSTWVATCHDGSKTCTGPTPLIAAMRCFVASKLGDEVDIPEELI